MAAAFAHIAPSGAQNPFSDADNAMVSAVAKAQKNTIVVMVNPGAVLTPWADEVPAIITNFMPGQAAGDAVADILFGKVNPSARLPVTFPNKVCFCRSRSQTKEILTLGT